MFFVFLPRYITYDTIRTWHQFKSGSKIVGVTPKDIYPIYVV